MRYQMSQKLFCFGNDFTIKDEHGDGAFASVLRHLNSGVLAKAALL